MIKRDITYLKPSDFIPFYGVFKYAMRDDTSSNPNWLQLPEEERDRILKGDGKRLLVMTAYHALFGTALMFGVVWSIQEGLESLLIK